MEELDHERKAAAEKSHFPQTHQELTSVCARALTDDDVLEDEGVVVRSRRHRPCGEQTDTQEQVHSRLVLDPDPDPPRARFSRGRGPLAGQLTALAAVL